MISDELLREKMNKVLKEDNSPDKLYEDYLTKHVAGVHKAYEEKIRPVLLDEEVDPQILLEIEDTISDHDQHKYSDEEWVPYRDYFYDKENHPRSSDAFNLAWNHHQNHSPHHWQYWCLINDVDHPQVQPLDMPFKYIIEMICDWQSAGNHYGNTAKDWYEKQKNKMILSDNTRKVVERYIDYLG